MSIITGIRRFLTKPTHKTLFNGLRSSLDSLEDRASPASLYWDGSGSDFTQVASWSTLSNAALPDPVSVPTATDIAVFSITGLTTAQTVNLNSDVAFSGTGGLAFSDSNATTLLGGNANHTLTLGSSGLAISSGSGPVTIGSSTAGQNVSLALAGTAQTWSNNSAYPATIQNLVPLPNSATNLTITGSGDTTLASISAVSNNAGQGTILNLNGTGTLRLTGNSTLNGNLNANLASGVSVDGGGSLRVTGALTGYAALQSNRGNFTNQLGQTSANNSAVVSHSGRFLAGGWTIGGGTFGNNSLLVNSPGTSGSPSMIMSGNGAQLNMGVSSSNNSLTLANSAYLQQQQGGGTNAWTIGTNNGANNNSIIVTGTGTTLSRSGAAGSSINVGQNGSGNSLTISNGGALVPRRLLIGTGATGTNNSIVMTGQNSIATINDSTNSIYESGSVAGANGNFHIVSDGAIFNYTGTGTNRNFSIGRAGDNNYLTVDGLRSAVNVNYTLPVTIGGLGTGTTATNGGTGNHLDLVNGGTLTSTATVLALGTNSAINLGNGTAISSLTAGATSTFTPAPAGVVLLNSSGSLNFNSGRLIAGSNGALISGAGSVNLNGTAYISTTQANSVVSLPLSGSGALVKEGSGQLSLTATNANTGATTVDNGTLTLDYSTNDTNKLADGAALNLVGGTLNLSGGSHAEVVASTTVSSGASAVSRSAGSAVLNAGDISRNLGGYINFQSGVVSTSDSNTNGILGPWATVDGIDLATVSGGQIVAYAGYTDIGSSGSVLADGSATNVRINATGSGTIALDATTINVNSILNNSTDSTTIDTAGKTLQTRGIVSLNGKAQLNVGIAPADGTLTSANAGGDIAITNLSSSPVVINAALADNASATSLSVSGTTTGVVQLAAANLYTGSTNVGGGKLQLLVSDALGTGAVNVNGLGAVLDLGATSSTVGTVTVDGGGNSSIIGTGTLTSTGGFLLKNGGTISAVLGGAVDLVKSSSGTVTLSAANTYTGNTTVSSGRLNSISNNAIPDTSILTVDGATSTFSMASSTFDQVAGVVLSNNGAISGSASLSSIASIDARSGWIGVNLTGSTGITKTTSGIVTLTGQNDYSGATIISAGTLVNQGPISSGGIGNNSAVTVDTGVLSLAVSDTVSSVTLQNGGSITSLGSSINATNGFVLEDGSVTAVLAGASTVLKSTTGTVTLSNDNTYSGGTTISGGTLYAGSQFALGTGSLGASAGTLEIGSNANATSRLYVGGGTFTGGTLKFDIRGNTPGASSAGYDQIINTGTLNLDNASLAVTLGAYLPTQPSFTIVSTTGSGTITGNFAGLPDGAVFSVTPGGQTFRINYTPTAVTLTVPVPTITSLSPSSGTQDGGVAIDVFGSGFTAANGTSSLSFGGSPVSFTYIDDNRVTLTSNPAGTGVVNVAFTTIGGTSLDTPADDFTYNSAVAPTLTALAPASGPTAGGNTVTITGTGLSGTTSVTFGGNAASFTFISNTTITATAPAGSGVVDVIVTNGVGTSANTAADDYTYVAAPSITTQPDAASVQYGNDVAYVAAATGSTSVQWQVNTGSGFANIPGANSPTLSLTRPTVASTGYLYQAIFSNAGGTATTNAVSLTVSAVPLTITGLAASNKPYDGTTTATVTGSLSGVISGDTVSFGTLPGTFADKYVGTDKPVTLGTIALSGPDAGNYTLTPPTTSLTADITTAPLTITGISVFDKTYDGTTDLIGGESGTLNGVLAGDTVVVDTFNGAFINKNVGTSKTIILDTITISGADAGNYTLTQPASPTASIFAAPLTVTAASATKVFDGTTASSTTPTISGSIYSGDTPTFLQTYDTAAPGSGKTLTPSGSVNDGNSGNNYAVTFVADAVGTITQPAPLIPVVANYTPNSGTVAGGTQVVFNGSNLGGASTTITFGGSAASFVSSGSGSITVTTPAHAGGAVDIVITTTGGSLTISNGFTYVAALTAIKLDGVDVTAPVQQRSTVRSITLDFNAPVTALTTFAAAITVTDDGGVAIPGLSLAIAPSGNSLTITFTDADVGDETGPVRFNSLADGRYRLSVNGSQLTHGGVAIDADGNGTAGGIRTYNFHRFFGDTDGDESVGLADLIGLQAAFGEENGALDFDNDGSVGLSDLLKVQENFGQSL